jgi:hypothetical protein
MQYLIVRKFSVTFKYSPKRGKNLEVVQLLSFENVSLPQWNSFRLKLS